MGDTSAIRDTVYALFIPRIRSVKERTVGRTTFTSSRFESGGEKVPSHLLLRSPLLSVLASSSALATSIRAGLLQLGETCSTKGSEFSISHCCVVSGVTGGDQSVGKGHSTSFSLLRVFPSLLLLQSLPSSAAFTMSSLKLHSSVPTSVAHAGASLQAKSSVLTGVQDAYWSDEEVRSKNTSMTTHPYLITYLYPLFCIGDEGVSPLPRGNGYLGSKLQAVPMRIPGSTILNIPSSFSPLHLFTITDHMNSTSRHRFADSAGITSGGTSTINAPHAGGITPTKLANSSLSISKSVCIYPIH